MAKPLVYDAVLRVRLTKEQFDFIKSYAEQHNTDMSQIVRDFIEKLDKKEKREQSKRKGS
ncbi:hypothetical protein IH992_34630 [Candidatus Poribacteria bacterium]|nr:hypothetical protein [Candidatus Poribacteria bacterium]